MKPFSAQLQPAPRPPARGSVLVGVLWCVALLLVIVVGVLHTSRMDLIVTRNYQDRIQAHYLAVAGIERAKALIHQDLRERTRSRQAHNATLFNSPATFRELRFGRGIARVARLGSPFEGGGVIFGVSDEESRLNINVATAEELGKLYGITPDVVAAIVDWRDGDNETSPSGAELDYYLSLNPPRRTRNGALETVDELLMVRGFTPAMLNGIGGQADLLPADLTDSSVRRANEDPTAWKPILTAHSTVKNLNAAGLERVNVQTADERALTSVPGISVEIARAIIAYRGQQRLESIVDLLNVTPPSNDPETSTGQPMAPARPPRGGSPMSPPQGPRGPRVINENLLMEIADDVTTQDDEDLVGVMNVNTASLEALMCLPGLTRESAQAIISFRQSNGYLPNIAWLLRVQGITAETLKQLAPRVCTRSETFRIRCEGQVSSSGTRKRIEEVVHIGLNRMTTLEYREDNL